MAESAATTLLRALLEPMSSWSLDELHTTTGLNTTQIKDTIDTLRDHGCAIQNKSPHRIQLERSGLGVWSDYLSDTLRASHWPNPSPRIEIYRQTASTQDVLRRLINASPATAPYAIAIADQQERGRGRPGRTWNANPGDALLMSIACPITDEEPIEAMPTRACLAIAETANTLPLRAPVSIAWPNDLLINHQKLAGVLVEQTSNADRQRWAIIGLGINVHARPDIQATQRTDNHARTPIALSDAGARIDRLQLAQNILERLSTLLRTPLAELALRWRHLSADLGQTITLRHANDQITGEVVDLDLTEGLILRDHFGHHHALPATQTTRQA